MGTVCIFGPTSPTETKGDLTEGYNSVIRGLIQIQGPNRTGAVYLFAASAPSFIPCIPCIP